MTKDEIITKVKNLKLSPNSFVLIGSCPMAAAGLRESNDIDMLVTTDVLEKFRKAGWQEVDKGPNDKPLGYDVFEAMDNCNFSSYRPSLKQVLSEAQIINEVPFASLIDVRKWKLNRNTPKDKADIKLIDEFLAKK